MAATNPKYRITAEPPGKILSAAFINSKGEREVIHLVLEPESEVEIDEFPPGVHFLPSNSMFPINDEARARFKERDDAAIAEAKAQGASDEDIKALRKKLAPVHSKSTRADFGDSRLPKVTPPPPPKPEPKPAPGGVVVSGKAQRASDT